MEFEKNEDMHPEDKFYEGLLPSYEKQETGKFPSYKDVVATKNSLKGKQKRNKATQL